MRLADYLETRCKKAGVSIRTGAEVTPDSLAADAPDAVVLATGARPAPPQIPGIDQGHVMTFTELMRGDRKPGKRIVILGGRGIGIAVAQYLLHEGGHEITMVEEAKKVGRDVNPSYIWRYKKKLKEGSVEVLTLSRPTAISDSGVTVAGPDGAEVVVAADTVVIAAVDSENELEAALKERFAEVHTIGDAAKVRRAHNATMDGHKIGLEV